MKKQLTPLKIVLGYAALSLLWIFFSDLLLSAITSDPEIYVELSIAKGWAFIIVTSVFIYSLVTLYARQRDRSQILLRETEVKFRDFLDAIQLVAVMLDTGGNIVFCNKFFLRQTGWERDEVLKKNWFDLALPEAYREEVRSVFKEVLAGRMPHHENPIVTRNGDIREIVWDNTVLHDHEGRATGTASIGIDVTEHRQVEEQLRQAQKMEAIGQFAGGIAHDFNNILSAMMGYVTLIQMKAKDEDPSRHYLDQLLAVTERASTLTKSLLAFSRKQILDIKPTSLNDTVNTLGKLLARVIGEDIKLNLRLSQNDIVVNADAGQLEQSLMNLATNARDAMPDGGTLTIGTEMSEMDQDFLATHGFGKAGKFALLTVEDTGIGMDSQTKARIFEPFFTTKKVGKGTGLGLAMVYGIIKQHSGYIDVSSEEGKGTKFMVYLPLIKDEAAESKPRENIPKSGGTETILLVEDEASLRQVTKSMLEEFGYKVIEAEDGNDAIKKYNEQYRDIDLVLMDVIMPQKSGKEAYHEMQKIRPDVKIIFMSGHTGDILTSKKIAEEGLHFISKPVSPRELFEKIREELDRGKA